MKIASVTPLIKMCSFKVGRISNLVGITRSFYLVTFISYGLGYVFRWLWITMIIPLTQGLIQKDFTFILTHKYVEPFLSFIPGIDQWNNTSIFGFFVSIILCLTLSSLALNYIIGLYIWRKKQSYSLRATEKLFQKYISLWNSFFVQQKSSYLRAKIESIPNLIDWFITTTQRGMQAAFEIGSAFAILLYIDLYLSWIASLFMVFSVGIFFSIRNVVSRAYRSNLLSGISFGSIVQDILWRQSLMTSSNTVEDEMNYFTDEYGKMTQKKYRFEKIQNLINPLNIGLQMTFVIFMGFLLSHMVLKNSALTVSAAFVFLILFHRMIGKIQNFCSLVIERMGIRKTLQETLLDVMSLQSPVISGNRKFSSFKDKIECKNLSFQYEKSPVLKNINCTISRGKITLIVGPNGSGKSTFINLLLRLYDCAPESIYLDGKDIREYSVDSWRTKIAYVAQDITLFHGTLLKNLTYGVKGRVSIKKINDLLKKVWLNKFVASLPDWLNTNIGDWGVRFSGGQRQRIAIARALLIDPQIIIFDEATKSVDTETEKLIMRMLVKEFQKTTRIIVSHNPAHKKLADTVIDFW